MAKILAKAIVIAVVLVASTARAAEPQDDGQRSARCAAIYAYEYGVPVELVDAVIEVESGWNPYAVSSKGAAGLMQLMPMTAIRFGVRDRFDIDENIRGGVAYLAWLIRLFGDDLRLALAAYNAGESLILSRGLALSSPEVYQYVNRVAGVYRALRAEVARNVAPPNSATLSRGGR
jgi:soluble lytic murein transglycosylase-like protein